MTKKWKEESNTRRLPADPQHLSQLNKQGYDSVVYAFLTANSWYDQETQQRYVKIQSVRALSEQMKEFIKTYTIQNNLAFDKRLSQQGTSKSKVAQVLNKLQDPNVNLLARVPEASALYQLNEPEWGFTTITIETLYYIMSVGNSKILDAYAFLKYKYWQHQTMVEQDPTVKDYEFSKKDLCRALGITNMTRATSYFLNNVIDFLASKNLIKVDLDKNAVNSFGERYNKFILREVNDTYTKAVDLPTLAGFANPDEVTEGEVKAVLTYLDF